MYTGGLFSIYIECDAATEDLLIAQLWEAGTVGIVEEPGGLRAFFDQTTPWETLKELLAGRAFSVEAEPERDYVRETEESFPALLAGSRFFLVPPWSREPTPEGRLRLEVNPGMACGTGWHPCTQLCLEALERWVVPGTVVLDVGTGSGILSQAARSLGAGRVLACDVDCEAVEVARQRVDALYFAGSADAVQTKSVDLLVANISAAAVEDLAQEFERVTRSGGVRIVSGFEEGELELTGEVLRKDGWVCVVSRA